MRALRSSGGRGTLPASLLLVVMVCVGCFGDVPLAVHAEKGLVPPVLGTPTATSGSSSSSSSGGGTDNNIDHNMKPADGIMISTSKRNNRKASLLFRGEVSVVSDPLPPETTPEDLSAFFRRSEHRLLFAASGGDEANAREVELTPLWQSMWKKSCDAWYGSSCLPTRGDSLFECDTYTNFPGLQVRTTIYTGVKMIATTKTTTTKTTDNKSSGGGGPRVVGQCNTKNNNKSNKVPRYCFLVIGQKQTAKGLPPIVWIFHQLMGTSPDMSKKKTKQRTKKDGDNTVMADHNDDGHNSVVDEMSSSSTSSSSSSLTTKLDPSGPVKSIISAHQDSDGRWRFRLDSSIQIKVEFPAVLLRILPSSKKRAEAQGSAAITKTVSDASRLGLKAAHQTFAEYRRRRLRK